MRFLFAALFVCSATVAFSQTAGTLIEKVLKTVPRELPKYVPRQRSNVLFLQTAFNDAVYKDQQVLQSLKGKVIVKVELIYTTYRKSETFDQHTLNRKRLNSLFAAAPNFLSQPGIEWILIAQTGCTSPETGKDFFHGVAITLRDQPSTSLVDAELAFLEAVADGTVPAHAYDEFMAHEFKGDTSAAVAAPKEPKISLPEFVAGERARIDYFTRNLKAPSDAAKNASERVVVQCVVDRNGKIQNIVFPDVTSPTPYHLEVMRFMRSMPDWKPGSVNDKRVDCMVTFTVDFMERGSVVASPLEIYAMDAAIPATVAPTYDYSRVKLTPQSKFVSETLAKNNWKNAALVCDVTASMAPYSAQLLSWLKNQFTAKDTAVVRYVFFNDGNNRKDISKRTGTTGGLYSFRPASFDDVLDQLGSAMRAGTGGDLPENNVEALLKAEADCPYCESLIMIADNYATPRDLSLAVQLTKPVNIIVCGASPALNEAYLNLARTTKGTLHFNNKSYGNLHTYEEGSTLQVGKEVFFVKGGKFVLRN